MDSGLGIPINPSNFHPTEPGLPVIKTAHRSTDIGGTASSLKKEILSIDCYRSYNRGQNPWEKF